jgi:MFS family permease
MTGLQGLAGSIWVIFVCRFMVGVFQAACNPPAYSIIADNFHPSVRTRATSIYSLGIYIGGALSSLTGLMISGVGWRLSFAIIGGIGVVAGVIGLFLLKEPPRGAFDVKKTEFPDSAQKVEKPPPHVQFANATVEIF